MGSIFQEIYSTAKETEGYTEKIFMTMAIILVALLVYFLIKKLSVKIFIKKKDRLLLRNTGKWILFFLAASLILYTWFNALEGFLIGISIFIALVVFSMRDLAINFAGYIYLKIRKPFKVGDSVAIGGELGNISSIEIFEFTMREVGGWLRSKQYTGVNIHLPNKLIFSQSFKNYTEDYPYIWFDIAFVFDLRSNINKVEELMNEIGDRQLKEVVKREQQTKDGKAYLDKLSNDMELMGGKIFSTVTSQYKLEGLEVALKVFCRLAEKSMVTTKIEREIIDMVNDNEDVEFASYPVKFYKK